MKNKSNMYGFINATWNPLAGECAHDCSYCYVKKMKHIPAINKKYSGELRLCAKAMKKNLGKNRFWFVGSMNDLFAHAVPPEWIIKILDYCKKFDNKYLFQSKYPLGIREMNRQLPENCIVGTTIETNRLYPQMGNVGNPQFRATDMNALSVHCGQKTMVTIEPIMDFDIKYMVEYIEHSKPEWVNIGADSQGHNLPEPSPEKIQELINRLSEFTEVKIKSNLKRIIGNRFQTH